MTQATSSPEKTSPETQPIELRHAVSEAEVLACWPVMQQLRPGLKSPAEFADRVRRMRADKYHLLAAWQGDTVLGLGGYHWMENFVYGKFLYLDDLVTLDTARGQRIGEQLIDALKLIAKEEACDSLVLDTALSNALAQRFYFRQGMLTGAMRFRYPISGKGAPE